jgi:hypothetical protein
MDREIVTPELVEPDTTEPEAAQAANCPYCGKPISPPPKCHRKCPHCRQLIRVRRGRLFTVKGEQEYDKELERDRERRWKQIGRECRQKLTESKRFSRKISREHLNELKRFPRSIRLYTNRRL